MSNWKPLKANERAEVQLPYELHTFFNPFGGTAMHSGQIPLVELKTKYPSAVKYAQDNDYITLTLRFEKSDLVGAQYGLYAVFPGI